MAIDEARLNAFLGKAVGDLGAAISAVLISIGDELGLYRALAKGRRLRRNSRATPAPTSATSASGSRTRPLAVMWSSTPRAASTP